jgi:pyroglutamyl-peptidase
MPATIVVSGFGPWAAARENPTLLVLERLGQSRAVAGHLTRIELPVDSAAVGPIVRRALDELRPDLWIGLGLALGSAVIAVERVAANVLDFAGPDIAGVQHDDKPVVAEGPAAYLATVPAKRIVEHLRRAGVPARVSNSASTFLCNQMMYTVLHRAAERHLPVRFGFLHVPAHPALVASLDGPPAEMPSMSLDLMTQAVEIAIATALATVG